MIQDKSKIPVLVAIMNDVFDFEILKRYHWYRIPVKSAPKDLTANKYIAFYQTKVFNEEKWAINYMAKIDGFEIVKRIDLLPEEKNNPRAKEDYYKIKVGRLFKLSKPIPSKRWRRIVFISTTLEKIKNTEEINDLFNDSPLENKLWENMKREGIKAERQLFTRAGNKKYCLDFGIVCEKGNIDIECDGELWHSQKDIRKKDRDRNNQLESMGWHVLRFDTEDINDKTDDCMVKIKRIIHNLAGIKDNWYE